ncbi:hypothetical protein RHGRI_006979 [Rhododendron griersonianum]|uniref:GST N-terminal domain-containing protein n=1 Tax=Rhododendron griersonianum TaxID=479676 RepID=A0AAV6KVX7_9ERIC|nr:hypothetical protein RHGRI_006979 [Rhododendron griersonianum]
MKIFLTCSIADFDSRICHDWSHGKGIMGSSYTPSKLPPKPLEVWAYEVCCNQLMSCLCYCLAPMADMLFCCARGSPKRQILYEKAGHFQVPYLEDPNTGVQMFESAEIVEYLRATYAL